MKCHYYRDVRLHLSVWLMNSVTECKLVGSFLCLKQVAQCGGETAAKHKLWFVARTHVSSEPPWALAIISSHCSCHHKLNFSYARGILCCAHDAIWQFQFFRTLKESFCRNDVRDETGALHLQRNAKGLHINCAQVSGDIKVSVVQMSEFKHPEVLFLFLFGKPVQYKRKLS